MGWWSQLYHFIGLHTWKYLGASFSLLALVICQSCKSAFVRDSLQRLYSQWENFWLNSLSWFVSFMGHILTPWFMLRWAWLQWHMAGCSMNGFILLCHSRLNPDFLELFCHSVIVQCVLGLQDQNWLPLIVVRAQPPGWWLWGRSWTFAAIPGPSVSEARLTSSLSVLRPHGARWWEWGNSWMRM